jgi:Zn ribbon nucleic-acid-binding protein
VTRRKREREDKGEDDRPPICPACGVTQGMVMGEDDETTFVCLECGFSDGRSTDEAQ